MRRSTSRLNLPARSTAPLEAQLRFSDGVYKVLRNPGELRIHYSSRVDAGVARIAAAGGPLNAR
jgi:hypothetical protein